MQNARRRLLQVTWIAECYNRSNARFLDTTGNEHRNVFDPRYAGTANHIDWDEELADYAVNVNLAAAVEAVHFQVDSSLRELGARNADYVTPTSNLDGRSICNCHLDDFLEGVML